MGREWSCEAKSYGRCELQTVFLMSRLRIGNKIRCILELFGDSSKWAPTIKLPTFRPDSRSTEQDDCKRDSDNQTQTTIHYWCTRRICRCRWRCCCGCRRSWRHRRVHCKLVRYIRSHSRRIYNGPNAVLPVVEAEVKYRAWSRKVGKRHITNSKISYACGTLCQWKDSWQLGLQREIVHHSARKLIATRTWLAVSQNCSR